VVGASLEALREPLRLPEDFGLAAARSLSPVLPEAAAARVFFLVVRR
jgi:hypothetical protein